MINTLSMAYGAQAPFSFAWISDTHLYPKNVNTRFVEKATRAVKEVQAQGLRVISLNQAGSVPDVADLVVSDPTQAGVMAVMAVAETAKFDLVRQLKRKY